MQQAPKQPQAAPLRPDDIPQDKWDEYIGYSTGTDDKLDSDRLLDHVERYRSAEAKKEQKKQAERMLKDKRAGGTNPGPVAKPAERDPQDERKVHVGLTSADRKLLKEVLESINPDLIDGDIWYGSLGMNNKLHGQGTAKLEGYGLSLLYTTDKKYRVALGYVEQMRVGQTITAARFINGQPTGKQCLDALKDNIEKDGK